jgi:hypothetical protein
MACSPSPALLPIACTKHASTAETRTREVRHAITTLSLQCCLRYISRQVSTCSAVIRITRSTCVDAMCMNQLELGVCAIVSLALVNVLEQLLQ